MDAWAQKHQTQVHILPLRKLKVWDANKRVGILGPVGDHIAWHLLFPQVNLLFTASPPSIGCSLGGKKRGLQCEDGWAFVQAVMDAFYIQACILTLECANEFKRHPILESFSIFLHFGFRRIGDQVVTYHQLSDCLRTRWISVWSGCDVPALPFDLCFTLRTHLRTAWHDRCYHFDLPPGVEDQVKPPPPQ